MRVPYSIGFETLDSELENVDLEVRGQLPDWLTGDLLRTGPARFEVGNRKYNHWFDGLAMLHAFHFRNGGVRYSNRFLRSKSFCEAEASGKISRGEFMTDPCRTIFGRIVGFFRPAVTDNANVNISQIGHSLVALTETPMPIVFDGETLKTLGNYEFEENVDGQMSTAHPHHDGERGFSYTIHMGRETFYRFFEEGPRRRLIAEIPVTKPSYLHSFGMSDRYLILVENPFRVHPLKLAFSGKPFITNYEPEEGGGLVFTVIDKITGDVEAKVTAGPGFVFHHVNAFEDGDTVVVDMVEHADASIIDRFRLESLRNGGSIGTSASLVRYRIQLGQLPKVERHVLSPTKLELPRINYRRFAGRPYRYVWAAGQTDPGSFLDAIVKYDLQNPSAVEVKTWAHPGLYAGEPVFVEKPNATREDDGVLLSVVLDTNARHSFLLILDAATLEELARIDVPHVIPFGFHGNYFSKLDKPDPKAAAAAR